MIKNLLISLSIVFLMAGCHDFEDYDYESDRTVLIYMAAENNLSSQARKDMDEILRAPFDDDNNYLLAYVDRAIGGELPYLVRIKDGQTTDSVSIADMGISTADEPASDPTVMERVVRYAFQKYPSAEGDYGLVLWGHASGWVVADSISSARASRQRRAYGGDTGNNSTASAGTYWLNMYTMARTLERLPHLTFIFADCCHFQAIESLYELRHTADYIIGSPAEIPACGAPYETVVGAMFEKTSFATSILDRYFEQVVDTKGSTVPLSAVKTSELDNLADATRQLLLSMHDTLTAMTYPDMTGVINYYFSPKFHDMNDFLLKYAEEDDYLAWKQALDGAVVYKKMSERWLTNVDWERHYDGFTMSEAKYGGVTMMVPQSPETSGYQKYNQDIRKFSWYYATGQSQLGW